MYGLNGAVLGTGSATGAVHVDHADVDVEYNPTWLCAVLLFYCQRLDGTGGAYLAAQVAIIVAVAFVKLHYGLHYTAKSVFHTCGLEHMAWTFAYAQMACRAMLEQVLVA